MPKVTHVLKARKAIEGTDIKKGDSYYWWKFRFGGKHCQKTAPRRSQLTQSEFYATVWDAEEEIEKLAPDSDLGSNVQNIADQLRELGETCCESLNNMPDSLQESETGQLLQERADACEAAADELEGIDCDPENKDEEETEEEFLENALSEIQGISIDAP